MIIDVQLTMMYGYYKAGKTDQVVAFDHSSEDGCMWLYSGGLEQVSLYIAA